MTSNIHIPFNIWQVFSLSLSCDWIKYHELWRCWRRWTTGVRTKSKEFIWILKTNDISLKNWKFRWKPNIAIYFLTKVNWNEYRKRYFEKNNLKKIQFQHWKLHFLKRSDETSKKITLFVLIQGKNLNNLRIQHKKVNSRIIRFSNINGYIDIWNKSLQVEFCFLNKKKTQE